MTFHLRCDRLINPLAVPSPHPRLSWRLSEGSQTAYRVVVDGRWDSGWVTSSSTQAEYAGEPVESFGRASWTVAVRLADGTEVVSESAFWEAGPAVWTGSWIEGERRGGARLAAPAPQFRRSLEIDGAVASARLYVTALGTADVTIDGAAVSDESLAPGWTDYRYRLHYRAHDVTAMLSGGSHELAATVGDGWYAGHVEWRPREKYGDRPRFRAILRVVYGDGRVVETVTDESWEVAYGPILRADTIMGQIEDRRQEWGPWRAVDLASHVVEPVPAPHEPIRPVMEIPALTIREQKEWPNSRYIADFGQNLTGRVRVRLKGKAGDEIRLRYAETLTGNTTGDMYVTNLRTAEATDWITLRGDEAGEVVETLHTFHGFRYMDFRGLAEAPTVEDVTAIVLHSDFDWAGEWTSDDPLLNQLWKNAGWGWRGNAVDVPTDCPQRDERLGWTGDAQVFCETSLYLSDCAAFWRKYVHDLIDAQLPDGGIPSVAPQADIVGHDGGPAWADVMVVVPWTVYRMTGDDTVLREAWPAMQRFVAYMEKNSVNGIRTAAPGTGYAGFGDWLNINAETPQELIGTAFLAYDSQLMAECASVLGHDPAPYLALREKTVAAFRRRYVTADGLVGSGSQTGYLLALRFGLLDEATRATAVQELVDDMGRRGWKLSSGFVGSPYICRVLEEGGRLDAAYKLLHQKEWPSFLYAVTQGATTIWERWDGWTADKGFQDAGMNSFNHYAYGAVAAWMMGTVAGIQCEEPGFSVIRFAPRPGGTLGSVSASHDGPQGRIEASWSRTESGFSYRFVVPPNSRAIIDLDGRETEEVGPGVWER